MRTKFKMVEMPTIVTGQPIPKRLVGRPRGHGKNLDLLKSLTLGDATSCIFRVSFQKMNSIRQSAHKAGIKVMTRRLVDGKYSIWLAQ